MNQTQQNLEPIIVLSSIKLWNDCGKTFVVMLGEVVEK